MQLPQALRIADEHEAQVAAQFLKALVQPGRNVSQKQILALLERSDYDGVIRLAQEAFDKAVILPRRELESQLAEVMLAYNDKYVVGQVLPRQVATGARLDLVNEEVANWAQKYADTYLSEIHAGIEPAVLDRIKQGIVGLLAPREIARSIVDCIGLTEKQNQQIDSFRAVLEKQRRKLERADGSVITFDDIAKADQKRLRLARPQKRNYTAADLTDAAIERNVLLYKAKKLKETALNLARTATIKASSEGQNALWNKAVERGYLRTSEWETGWIVTPDDRLCPICAARRGMRREIDGQYPDGTGVPPLHNQCRCAEGLYRKKVTRHVA